MSASCGGGLGCERAVSSGRVTAWSGPIVRARRSLRRLGPACRSCHFCPTRGILPTDGCARRSLPLALRHSSRARLVLWARYVGRCFLHRAPRIVYLALGVINGLVAYGGESQGRRVGKRRTLRVLPRAGRIIGRSIRGPDHCPRPISSARRRFHPSAEEPRPPSCPLDPLALDPGVCPRWLARYALDATRRGRGSYDDERLGTLWCKRCMGKCRVTSGQQEATDCKEKWAKH